MSGYLSKQIFTGRDAELDSLIEAWKRAKSGQPGFIAIIADSGFGKTRLVHEFYSWLSLNEDGSAPRRYWPEQLGTRGRSLEVNPDFSQLDAEAMIPWLWWGMRWTRITEDDRNAAARTLDDFVEYPLIHLRAIGEKRQQAGLAKEGVEALVELGANLIPFAGMAYGVVKNFLKLYSKHAALADQKRESHADLERKSIEQRIEQCYEYLSITLDPQDKEAATIPVIMVLDDAQWMDSHTLSLLRRIFSSAVRHKWPLLIIATHWEAEWLRQVHEGPGQNNLYGLSREVADHWHTLTLGKLDPASMVKIVREKLPGVTAAQAGLIVTKVDGNPLYLEDILLYFHGEDEVFLDDDRSQALSRKGEGLLSELLDADHVTIIKKRFRKLSKSLRVLLGQASYQGIRFLHELTAEVAARLGKPKSELSLAEEFRVASQVEAIISQSADQASEFRQRVFYEVARAKFSADQDEEEYGRAMMSVVMEWYRADRLVHLSPGDLAGLRQWVIDNEAFVEEQSTSVFIDVMLRQASYQLDHLAYAAAESLLSEVVRRAESKDHQLPVSTTAQVVAMNGLGQARLELHDLARALEYFEDACAISKVLEGRDRQAFALSLQHAGYVHGKMGRFSQAVSRHQEALAIWKDIFGCEDGTVAVCLNNLGLIYWEMGDTSQAQAHFENAIAITEKAHGRMHTGLATQLSNLARLYMEAGDSQRAVALMMEAVSIREKNQGRSHPGVAASLSNLGAFLLKSGDPSEALPLLEESLALTERVYGRTHRNVATILGNIGYHYVSTGHNSRALPLYEEALQIRRRTYDQIHLDVASSLLNLGTVCIALNDLPRALALHEEAEGMLEELLPPGDERLVATSRKVREIQAELGLRTAADDDPRGGDLPAT